MQRLFSGNHLQFLSLNPRRVYHRLLLFSTTSTTASAANYLVDSLGFSHRQALSASTRLYKHNKVNDFKFVANANSVVGFFKSHGFNDTHLRKMVNLYPTLLCSNVDLTIQPIFMFLQSQGLSGSDLIRVISENSKLLLTGLDSSISPALEILRKLLGCDALVIAVIKRLCRDSFNNICKNLMPNVDFLTSYGIPIELIRKHLVHKPMAFMRNPGIFKDMVIRVESKIGIARDDPMFLYGIHLLNGYSEETIESKCRMFKSFGWTQSDVATLMMKIACCFSFSDASIKKKLDFLMHELGFKPEYLTSNCAFFTYSLERKIVPRHKVLLILKGKGLLEKYPSLSTVVRMSEPCFSKRFVIPFREVHQVYKEYTGSSYEDANPRG